MLASVINPSRSSIQTHGVSRDLRENFRANQDNLTHPDTSSTSWGDPILLPKPDQTFRFIFQNIQGLPVNPNSHKHKQIGTALKETEANVFGIAELNLNFPVLGPSFQWSERFRHLYRNHSVHSCNKHDTSKKRTLFGGTAQIATGACSHRTTEWNDTDGHTHLCHRLVTLWFTLCVVDPKKWHSTLSFRQKKTPYCVFIAIMTPTVSLILCHNRHSLEFLFLDDPGHYDLSLSNEIACHPDQSRVSYHTWFDLVLKKIDIADWPTISICSFFNPASYIIS